MAYWVDPIIKGEDISQKPIGPNEFLYLHYNYYFYDSHFNRHFTLMIWNAFSFQYQNLKSKVYDRLESQLKLPLLQRQTVAITLSWQS